MSAPDEKASPGGERPSALIQSTGTDYRQIALRIALVVLNLGSFALLWWSLQKLLLPLQKQARDSNATMTRLISEVDRMEHAWSAADIEQVRTNYNEVPSWMFVGRPALEAWLGEVKERVVPLALEVAPEINRSDPAAPGSTNTVPTITSTTLALKVRPAAGIEAINSPFQRTLQFSQQLTAEQKRADLVELTVVGGANSVEEADLILQLWTSEEGDFR